MRVIRRVYRLKAICNNLKLNWIYLVSFGFEEKEGYYSVKVSYTQIYLDIILQVLVTGEHKHKWNGYY